MNKIIYEKLENKIDLIPVERQHYFYKFPKQLFTTNNTKIIKGMKKGVLTGILHMLPDTQVKDFLKDASIPTVCPTAKLAGCFKDCLVFSGRGTMSPVFYSRLLKTLFYLQYKNEFIKLVDKGIVESVEYYNNVEQGVFPLLDYLRTNEVEQLYKWLNNTYSDMNVDTVNNGGIEYIIAVKTNLNNTEAGDNSFTYLCVRTTS